MNYRVPYAVRNLSKVILTQSISIVTSKVSLVKLSSSVELDLRRSGYGIYSYILHELLHSIGKYGIGTSVLHLLRLTLEFVEKWQQEQNRVLNDGLLKDR